MVYRQSESLSLRPRGTCALAGVFALSACISDLALSPGELSPIGCESSADCPTGTTCEVDLRLCLPADSADGEAAQSTSLTVSPEVISSGTLTVSISFDHTLLGSPVLTLSAGTFSRSVTAEPDGDGYLATIDVDAAFPEGEITVLGAWSSEDGVLSANQALGTFTVDRTAPTIVSVQSSTWVDDGGETWSAGPTDTFTVTLSSSESGLLASWFGDDLQDDSADIDDTLDVTWSGADGLKVLFVQVEDAAGNTSDIETIEVTLETDVPSTALTLASEGTEGDVTFNGDTIRIDISPASDLPHFVEYEVSDDDGSSWTPIGTSPTFDWPLAPDSDASLRVREKDVFGNVTPDAEQGMIDLHEDSLPPSAPRFALNNLITKATDRGRIALLEAAEDERGVVQYQLFGGPYTDFTDITLDGGHVVLPGLSPEAQEIFLLRAVDAAGNGSASDFVLVYNDGLRAVQDFGCTPTPCFTRTRFHARHRIAYYTNKGSSSSTHGLKVCTFDAMDAMICEDIYSELRMDQFDSPFDDIDAYLPYIVFDDKVTGSQMIDIGADGVPGTPDDNVIPWEINSDARCARLGPRGVIHAVTTADAIYIYQYGDDRTPDTGDTNEINVQISPAGEVIWTPSCEIEFNGRHIAWLDKRRETVAMEGYQDLYLYDLGEDLMFGTADDGAETEVAQDITQFSLGPLGLNYTDDVGAVGTLWWGPDGVPSSGDEGSETPPAASLGFQTAFVPEGFASMSVQTFDGDELFPVETNSFSTVSVTGSNGRDGMVFLETRTGVAGDAYGGFFALAPQNQTIFMLGSAQTIPNFHLSENLAFVGPTGDPTEGLVIWSPEVGGNYAPTDGWPTDMVRTNTLDIDVRGTAMVWRDDDEGLSYYDLGTDGQAGTSDDIGPVVLVDTVPIRWPRLSGRYIVYADASGDADQEWLYGADVAFEIFRLDLGADGLPTTADDVTLSFAAGEVFEPDVSVNGSVLWHTLENDGDGLCTGSPSFDETDLSNCDVDIDQHAHDGSGPVTVVDQNYAQLDASYGSDETIIWTDSRASNGIDGVLWDVYADFGAGEQLLTASSEYRAAYPIAIGSVVGFVGWLGVEVFDVGADLLPRTSDDTVLAEFSASTADPFNAARWRWLSSSYHGVGPGLTRLSAEYATDSQTLSVAIPDDGTQASDTITLSTASWEQMIDFTIDVDHDHPAPEQLKITLSHDGGVKVTVFDGRWEVFPSDGFDLLNAPALFSFYARDAAGDWSIEIEDFVADGQTGSLLGWEIRRKL